MPDGSTIFDASVFSVNDISRPIFCSLRSTDDTVEQMTEGVYDIYTKVRSDFRRKN